MSRSKFEKNIKIKFYDTIRFNLHPKILAHAGARASVLVIDCWYIYESLRKQFS